MPIFYALSQLAILGAQSVLLADGRLVELHEVVALIEAADESARFVVDEIELRIHHASTGALLCWGVPWEKLSARGER